MSVDNVIWMVYLLVVRSQGHRDSALCNSIVRKASVVNTIKECMGKIFHREAAMRINVVDKNSKSHQMEPNSKVDC